MNCEQERLYLTFQELQTLICLGGKETVFGFQAENDPISRQEQLWEACCRLMADGMIIQQDGKIRLHRDLQAVVKPIFDADKAWVLMPGTGDFSQVIYYLSAQISAMEKNVYGGYSLWPVQKQTLTESVLAVLNFENEALPRSILSGGRMPNVWDDTQTLLEDCVFLLELVDTASALRLRWIRGVKQGQMLFLEWSENDRVNRAQLTKERLNLCLMQDN